MSTSIFGISHVDLTSGAAGSFGAQSSGSTDYQYCASGVIATVAANIAALNGGVVAVVGNEQVITSATEIYVLTPFVASVAGPSISARTLTISLGASTVSIVIGRCNNFGTDAGTVTLAGFIGPLMQSLYAGTGSFFSSFAGYYVNGVNRFFLTW